MMNAWKEKQFADKLRRLRKISEEFRISINKKKVKVTAVEEEKHKLNTQLHADSIKQAGLHDFEYLAVRVEDTGKQEIEIRKSILECKENIGVRQRYHIRT